MSQSTHARRGGAAAVDDPGLERAADRAGAVAAVGRGPRPHLDASELGVGAGGAVATGSKLPGGAPLPSGLRGDLESRFGAGLGHVRVHGGAHAAERTAADGAQAIADGADIMMGAGAPDPASRDGRALIGHEVAHVLQGGPPRRKPVDTKVYNERYGGSLWRDDEIDSTQQLVLTTEPDATVLGFRVIETGVRFFYDTATQKYLSQWREEVAPATLRRSGGTHKHQAILGQAFDPEAPDKSTMEQIRDRLTPLVHNDDYSSQPEHMNRNVKLYQAHGGDEGTLDDMRSNLRSTAQHTDLPTIAIGHGNVNHIKVGKKNDRVKGKELIDLYTKVGLNPGQHPFHMAFSCNAGLGISQNGQIEDVMIEAMAVRARRPAVGPMGYQVGTGSVASVVHPATGTRGDILPDHLSYAVAFPADLDTPQQREKFIGLHRKVLQAAGCPDPVTSRGDRKTIGDRVRKLRELDDELSVTEKEKWKAVYEKNEDSLQNTEPTLWKKITARRELVKLLMGTARGEMFW